LVIITNKNSFGKYERTNSVQIFILSISLHDECCFSLKLTEPYPSGDFVFTSPN